MSLERVHDPLSLALIRRLGDAGGPRADQVAAELDNLIAWARTSPRCIHRNFTQVGNVGTGLDALMSYTIPSGTLPTNNDYLIVYAAGAFAANDDNKRLEAQWNGTAFFNSGLIDLDTFGWQVCWIIGRQSATTIAASVQGVLGNVAIDSAGGIASNGANSRTASVNAFAANNFGSSTNTLSFHGESATATNDNITQNILIVELCQQ